MDEQGPGEDQSGAADEADDAIPTQGYRMQPVVGLGGSAGAIQAIQNFLRETPPDTGLAFVVVLHLSPEHESTLDAVLQAATSMPVVRAAATQRIEPDRVYVIPPRKALRTLDGHLQLTELPRERYRHVAVDLFFRTLADSHGPHATAVVFSGMDGDGAAGIKRIKERGGLTIAQEPEEAEYSGMPRAAILTGMVDWVLPAAEMPRRIVDYQRLERQLLLPPEQPSMVPQRPRTLGAVEEGSLRDVLAYLRSRTGRDFSCYKRATVLRRIGRRMQVNGISDLPNYLSFLRTHSGEAGALLQDLLISVTNFFRDGDCFTALAACIPQLFAGKSASDTLRIWVAACATGEEAYSVAMLLAEHARTLDAPPQVQVFATDLDDEAIRIARDGVYPAAIEADVSEDRLRRFFIKEHHGYRLRREIREMVLFAVHDVLKDSPFSRVELVACRNLLIYLDREAQAQVLGTFHFALQPSGLLFLGSSESVDDGSQLFTVHDKKHRIYRHRATPRIGLPVPAGSGTLALEAQHAGRVVLVVPGASLLQPPPTGARSSAGDGRVVSWGELHFRLLEQLAPPSLLVDAEHELVHLSPGAGRFLQFAGGEPSRNLLRTIHPSLRIELRAALYQAAQTGQPVDVDPLPIDMGGEQTTVAMSVRPVGEAAPGLLLVLLRSGPASAGGDRGQGVPLREEGDPVARHLDRELERLKLHLRDTVEQYEVSTEELKASNEELQAMNEELRSATEELETSREELQSINEELTTVNHELKNKVDELGHSNSDMHNLMDATAIATVFLDRELRITRYTPSAVSLFNLIPTDVGRPLAHLTTQLDYADLTHDARRVLERLVPVEREVSEAGGNAYLVRMLPYRTLDDRIAGVVLTLVDISERKRGQEALRLSEERFSTIVNQTSVGVTQVSLDGRLTFANSGYCDLLGYTEAELVGRPLADLVHPDDRARAGELFSRLASTGEPMQIEKRCLRKDGSVIWLHNSLSFLTDGEGRPRSALVVSTDISERKLAEEALRSSEEWMRLIIENAVEYAIFSVDNERNVTTWNTGAERLLGYTEAEVLGRSCDVIFTPEDRQAGVPQQEVARARAEGRASDDRLHVRKDGSRFWASGAMMPMHDGSGEAVGFVKILRDQSDERAIQQALEDSRAALEAADAAKDRFLAVLSHELRNPLASVGVASSLLATGHLTPAERQHAAHVIERQSGAMRTLLDDLLDVSRLRLGRLTLRPRATTARELIESAIETTRPLIDGAQHRLSIALPPEAIGLRADPVRISQVLSNLLSNAVKYTPPPGHLAVAAEVQGDAAVFTVSDDGIGMEPEAVEGMFEMFSQSAQPEHRGGGLGIGLALARSIVELHGGRVTGASEGRDRGSRFTVTLPLAGPPQAAAAAEPAAPASPPLQAPPIRVLVADDNIDAAWGLAKLLEIWGCAVSTVGGGKRTLAEAERHRPAVIVLDIGMPDLSGLEVARRLRAEPWAAGVLLVAATGWGQQADRDEALAAGFDAHLVKPIVFSELQALIVQHHAAGGADAA
ncbi:PAS domain S-box protein [Aquincola sp. MAHUQ-54]|uniref:PAS domain S-box protein n=1 Tax=Aquincola agrisoli TaxID=3119538 RepID=A0AAW9QEJ3_9BURK